jgi:hypothetical protein
MVDGEGFSLKVVFAALILPVRYSIFDEPAIDMFSS